MSATFNDSEWKFIYATFEQLMSPRSTDDEIVEALVLEDRIWELLQEKEKLRLSTPESTSSDGGPSQIPGAGAAQ